MKWQQKDAPVTFASGKRHCTRETEQTWLYYSGATVLISLAEDATGTHNRPAEGDKAGASHFDKWLLFTHDCQTLRDVWLIT